jgi:hypothetical protein
MILYDLIVIDYNQIRIEYIDLIFFCTFLYSPYIPINRGHLNCKFIKRNNIIM